jgi:SAM-dependent methyltransferase
MALTADNGAERPWWEAAFGAEYLQVYAHRDDAAAAGEIAGLVPRLRRAGGVVVDAGCGSGRHLAALRGADLTVVGFDLSEALLTTAATRPLVSGRLARGDVRAVPFASASVDAVVLLFTVFGYFDEATNAATLRELARPVRPGGWILLDLPRPAAVRQGLVPESERRLDDGTVIVERRRLEGRRVLKDVQWQGANGTTRTWQESVRLYEDAEIQRLALAAGCVAEDTWNSLRGPGVDDRRRVFWLRRLGS